MRKKRIAILGSTGYIGRSLVASADLSTFDVVAFSRDSNRAQEVFRNYEIEVSVVESYDTLLDQEFDVLINATGVGSPKRLNENPIAVFLVTEEMDAMLLRYLEIHPATKVFNISSGAVYGLSVKEPITNETNAVFDLNKNNSYSVAKLMSEVKHRAIQEYAIIDLRVFAFVSRWLDVGDLFFISEVAKCLQEGSVFHTTASDMIRDYASADDLWSTIRFLLKQPSMNAAFDIRSQSPVSKFVLLEHLKKVFNLKYEIIDIKTVQSVTGEKNAYYSESSLLINLGYAPEATSSNRIENEIRFLLAKA